MSSAAQHAARRPTGAVTHSRGARERLSEVVPISPWRTAMVRGLERLAAMQGEDGSFRGAYGGPMFLLPMYVAACHIGHHPISALRGRRMIDAFHHAQNADGSIGLHLEDDGSMFATVLSYVALRLLGQGPNAPRAARMRGWIQRHGTALGSASWGKHVLALLNLYPYEGLHPVLPELWLLPYALPFHPGRLWCHCRQVYLPMAQLYATKATIGVDSLVRTLREELYDRPYEEIDFRAQRDNVAPCDDRFPASLPLRAAQRIMGAYEDHHLPALRRRALAKVLEHIHYEDAVTHYIDIGPVNRVLNTLVHHFDNPRGEALSRSWAQLDRYLGETDHGVELNGYNSTALWDTAFTVQALAATPLAADHGQLLGRAHAFIRDNQVLEDVPEPARHYRHASRGGWPFSDRLHGWPITDCTAEGFKSMLALEALGTARIDAPRLRDSVRLMLSLQNPDGGWATYERQRAGAWLERLNPSQVFGDIMVDYSYVECTSACMQALVQARRRFPGFADRRIARALQRGERFVRRRQQPHGGWVGSWAVCFTYGTWFGVWGLRAAGARQNDRAVRRAAGFLLQRQNADGGWGEHHTSCYQGRYVRADESHAVQTSWALMALTHAGLGHTEAVRRGAHFLVQRQEPSGDWPVEPLVGVFNKTSLINYDNYRRYFPIWALAEVERAQRA